MNLIEAFKSAEWRPARDIARDYVLHSNPDPSPGLFWHVPASCDALILSVLIPTADADRGGYFKKLLGQIDRQQMRDFELIVIRGDPRQGRAINIGAALAAGKYLLTLDDDSSLPDTQTFGKLVAAMDVNPGIGMAGGNNTVPDRATPFVQRVMRQLPRRSWEPVKAITDSDLAEHPCLIMRTGLFRRVGGENELIPRGLDPYLRQRFREAGTRICLIPGVIYHHLPPATWKKLLCQFYRNGCQAAYANIHYPEWVIETPSTHGEFKKKLPLWLRLLRFPFRMIGGMLTGRWIWVVCEACYAFGFMRGWMRERGMRDDPAGP